MPTARLVCMRLEGGGSPRESAWCTYKPPSAAEHNAELSDERTEQEDGESKGKGTMRE